MKKRVCSTISTDTAKRKQKYPLWISVKSTREKGQPREPSTQRWMMRLVAFFSSRSFGKTLRHKTITQQNYIKNTKQLLKTAILDGLDE